MISEIWNENDNGIRITIYTIEIILFKLVGDLIIIATGY